MVLTREDLVAEAIEIQAEANISQYNAEVIAGAKMNIDDGELAQLMGETVLAIQEARTRMRKQRAQQPTAPAVMDIL